MSRLFIKLDLTLNTLIQEIEEKIESVIEEEHALNLSHTCKQRIHKAIHDVLAQDIVQSDLCGFSICCRENVAEFKAPTFDQAADQ